METVYNLALTKKNVILLFSIGTKNSSSYLTGSGISKKDVMREPVDHVLIMHFS